jgi:hypothetical protein
MFKGVSQCVPAVNTFYIGQFNHLCYFPLPCGWDMLMGGVRGIEEMKVRKYG